MDNGRFSWVFNVFILTASCSCAGGHVASNEDGAVFAQTNLNVGQTLTFSVCTPNLADIHSQDDVYPCLYLGDAATLPLPEGVPLYLRSGEEVQPSYIGYRGYTVDVVCDSFDGSVIDGAKKIIVNETHEQVRVLKYRYAEILTWGERHYFQGIQILNGHERTVNYVLDEDKVGPYGHILAGYYENVSTSHVYRAESLTSEEGTIYADHWDFGPILYR